MLSQVWAKHKIYSHFHCWKTLQLRFYWWIFLTTYHCEHHLTGMFQDPLPVIRSQPVSQTKLQVPGQRTIQR